MERKESVPICLTQLHSLERSRSTDPCTECASLWSAPHLCEVLDCLEAMARPCGSVCAYNQNVLWGSHQKQSLLSPCPVWKALMYCLLGYFLWAVHPRPKFGYWTEVEFLHVQQVSTVSTPASAFPHLEIILATLVSVFNCWELQVI